MTSIAHGPISDGRGIVANVLGARQFQVVHLMTRSASASRNLEREAGSYPKGVRR